MLIAGIQDNLMEALEQHDLHKAAKTVEASLKIIHEEDLTQSSAEVHESLARIYCKPHHLNDPPVFGASPSSAEVERSLGCRDLSRLVAKQALTLSFLGALGDRNLARHWARKCVDLRCDWDVLEVSNRTKLLQDLMSTFQVF